MGSKPDPHRRLSSEIRRINGNAQRQSNAPSFFNTGLNVNGPGVLNSDTYVPGVSGFSLNGGTGNIEVNDIVLRGGIIGNDALSNPVSTGQAFVGTSGFGLTVAGSWLLTRTATVPSGFDTVTVSAFGRCAAINSTANGDGLYTALDVNGSGGNQFSTFVPAGQASTSSVGFATTLTGLTAGASVVTRLFASTGLASWAANGANGADLSVTYLWTR
jgi:hypothetical protein